MQTKLKNLSTGVVIELDDELYPVDEHNWSPVVSTAQYTLSGALVIHESRRKAGKPITLKSQPDMGLLTRETLNQLYDEAAKLGAEYMLDYRANETVESVKVKFDHSTGQPIEAEPLKGFISPYFDDYFKVTLRFIAV